MEDETSARKFWRWFAPNPLWDAVKLITVWSFSGGLWKIVAPEFRRTPVDWYVVGALFLISIGLCVFVYLKAPKESPQQQGYLRFIEFPDPRAASWEGYESQAAKELAVAEQNRLIDVGRALDGLFNPLQTEALKLSKDLGTLLLSAGPLPGNPPASANTDDAKRDAIWAGASLRHNRALRLRGVYAEEFAPRVRSIINHLRQDGYNEIVLPHFANDIPDEDAIQRVRARLWIYLLRSQNINLAGEA